MSITKFSYWGYAGESPGEVSYRSKYINCGLYYNPGPLIGVKLGFPLSEIMEGSDCNIE